MANGDTKTESYLRVAAEGTRADLPSDTCCNTKTQNLILGVANRIMDVEDEVEEMKSNPDVADIVDTYADLQAYDTQHLTDKDIVRVLTDEQHDGQSTYYRFTKNPDTWTYIGAVGDYYTKGQVDDLLDDKQDVLTAGTNITIDANNEISAVDTTYSDFVGTDGQTAGTAGLVPAPVATDADKFLKSDGTWDAVEVGPTVVQTTGQSTTDVMSQKAVTDTIDDLSTVEYVNLTITGTSGQAFTTSADKTTSEIVALVADDKKVIFKLNYTATGTPINPGVYEFPLTADFNVGGGHAIGGAAAGWVSSKPAVYVYIQNGVDGRAGTIDIKLCATPTDVQAVDSKVGDLANLTTTDKTSTVAAINEIVTMIGNIEAALNVINNGGNA